MSKHEPEPRDGVQEAQKAQEVQEAVRPSREQEEEARQQEQNQSQAENIQYEAPTQPGWTQSYGAVVMTDAHSDAWAAVNFTSQFLADESALRACRAFAGRPATHTGYWKTRPAGAPPSTACWRPSSTGRWMSVSSW